MSDLLDTGSATPAGPQKPPVSPTMMPPVSTAPDASAPEPSGLEAEEKAEKKPTNYVVLVATEESGPWTQIGMFTGSGQTQAKKLAAVALNGQGNDAAAYYYVAIPQSSFAPEKPKTVEVETRIAF